MQPQEITDILTPEGVDRIKVGEILMFRKEGKRLDMKITRKTKSRVWAKQVTTYHRDALVIREKAE